MPKPKSLLRSEAQERQLAYDLRVNDMFRSVAQGRLNPTNLFQLSRSQLRRLKENFPDDFAKLEEKHPELSFYTSV